VSKRHADDDRLITKPAGLLCSSSNGMALPDWLDVVDAIMIEKDVLRTRTAEVCALPPIESSGERSARTGGEDAPREETSSLGAAEAAISFARERERALQRSEHTASVQRLRRALCIGLIVWLATVPYDVWITHYTGEGDLPTFLILRACGVLLIGFGIWRLSRLPEPSMATLWWCDAVVFTGGSTLLSLMTISFRGIASPYASAIIAVLVARGATTLAPWRRGVWLFGFPALAYPITLFIASRFDARIDAQFADRLALGQFVSILWLILECWAMLTVGGHFAWRLRREALETRNIGRYKLERRLGSGGMAEVWAAFDVVLSQHVALKTVGGQQRNPVVLQRLEREVRALAELKHPNTVRVLDYGVTDDGLWYYAMELLHGENLRDLVAREGPMPVPRLLSIARQVLRALGEAHGKGIIHRDIKPENVFVAELGGESDVVKLLDFGIAKATLAGDATLTNTGFVAGTPAYMAPELMLGCPADARSDLYSFGATLYFAMTGGLPFPDRDPAAVLAAHLNTAPAPLSAKALERIPPALERIVRRCMAKDPTERPTSTRALLDELELIFLDGVQGVVR
jgi:serine/threonine-protein kinase